MTSNNNNPSLVNVNNDSYLKALPATEVYNGRAALTSSKATSADSNVINNDSPINCLTSWSRVAPATLRSPISFIRLNASAVEILIKLTAATNSMNNATMEKMYTYLMSLLAYISFSSFECR